MREVERVFQVEGTLQTKALRREKANASTCWKEFCVVGFKSKNRVERMQLARRAGPDQKSLWWPTEYSLTSLTTHHLYPKPPYLSLISCLPQLILFQPCILLTVPKTQQAHPTSGPLHLLFLLPGELFPLMSTWLTSSHPPALFSSVTFSGRPSLSTKLNSSPHRHTHTTVSPFPAFFFFRPSMTY